MKRLLRVPRLGMPRLGLASFRRRIIFRGAFLLLISATLALALAVLHDEKQRSYSNYRQNFKKTQAEIVARLRHPGGQLALLNPGEQGKSVTPLRPLLLPYAALDFDDLNKAQQAVEMAGCAVQYEGGASLCVAIGNNPYAGGFIYVVGSVLAPELVGRRAGQLDLADVYRARIRLDLRGEQTQWLAPFEAQSGVNMARGRLTGFLLAADNDSTTELPSANPARDFRGWMWQGGRCIDDLDTDDCQKRTWFSIRLPVEAYSMALFQQRRPTWPPTDLAATQVHIELFAPNRAEPLFDSNASSASRPLSLNDLSHILLPGEQLQIRKLGKKPAEPVILKADVDGSEKISPWLHHIVSRLPVEGYDTPLREREIITTPAGNYEVLLTGDVRGIDREISIVATRLLWLAGAMLAAIILAWLVIEIGLIRRIAVLTKRAAAVSCNVQDAQAGQGIVNLDLSDLRGSDELGILAGGLADLLQRVKDDIQREHIRAQQERDMWQAVGHEIMSPLQSLMVLHPKADDASHRYVQRMQQAVRVLYGTASPSEALEAATLQVGVIDLDEFLQHIATNAPFAGIDNVIYQPAPTAIPARADEFPLEDAVTHILRNAERYRHAGTPITLTLTTDDATASIRIHNQGAVIADALRERIFEYGVSEATDNAHAARRGQGLFVAKTYMAKMGGTIAVENVADGVVFALSLQRAS